MDVRSSLELIRGATLLFKNRPLIWLTLVLATIAVLSLLFATDQGIGVSADSVLYLDGARNISLGRGFTSLYERVSLCPEVSPITEWPPLFSSLVAAASFFVKDATEAARWLNIMFFAANTTLVGILIHKYTNRSVCLAALGSFLTVSSVLMLNVHSMAWSEPGFIFFSLCGLALLGAYIDSGSHSKALLIGASLAIGLGLVTRYLGVGFLAGAAIGTLLLSSGTFRRKLLRCAALLCIGLLPLSLWLVRNRIVAGSMSERHAAKWEFHSISVATIKTVLLDLSAWLWPESAPGTVRKLLLLTFGTLVVVGLVLLWRRRWSGVSAANPHQRVPIVSLITVFIVVYCITLALVISIPSLYIAYELRYLSPIQPLAIILVVCTFSELFRVVATIRRVRVLLVLLSIALVGSYTIRGARFLLEAHRGGQGYTSKAWRESETISAVRSLPREGRIYSNGPDAIYLLAGNPSCSLPLKFKLELYSEKPSGTYESEFESMKQELLRGRAVLVYFNSIHRQYLPSEEELLRAVPLKLILATNDGAVYGSDSGSIDLGLLSASPL